jgi:Tol biopolymer transport system component
VRVCNWCGQGKELQVNSNRTRDIVLTFIGGVAVLAYVLACTSFSPDDSKVLFPAFDRPSGGLALAVYDRDRRRTEHLFALPGLPSEDRLLRAAWTPDGRRVLALWPESAAGDRLHVVVLPCGSREPVRVLVLPLNDDAQTSLVVPPAIIGSALFVGGEAQVARLDLETGAVQTNAVEGAILLAGHPDGVFYLRELPDAGVSAEEGYEGGRLDLRTLTCQPLLRVAKMPGQEIHSFFAVTPDASRWALSSTRSNRAAFLLYDGKTLTRALPATAADEELRVGNFVFSRDGSTLYATFMKPAGDPAGPQKAQQCGVLEVPTDGSTPRPITLFRLAGDPSDETVYLFQLDRSHDGKTLAVCSTYLALDEKDALQPEDLALYLVDLSRRDRRVTKIPIAPPPKAPPATDAGR